MRQRSATTGVGSAVAGGTDGADKVDLPSLCLQPGGEIFADLVVVLARWVAGGDADQVLGQADRVCTAGGDGGKESGIGHGDRVQWERGVGKNFWLPIF